MALEVELQQNIVAARRGVGIFGQQHRTESNPSRTERSRQRNDQELPLLRAQDGTSLTSTPVANTNSTIVEMFREWRAFGPGWRLPAVDNSRPK